MVAYRIQAGAGAVDGARAGDTRKKILDRGAEPRRGEQANAAPELAWPVPAMNF